MLCSSNTYDLKLTLNLSKFEDKTGDIIGTHVVRRTKDSVNDDGARDSTKSIRELLLKKSAKDTPSKRSWEMRQ